MVLLGIDKEGQWHVNDASQYLLNAHDPAHIALNPSEVSVATVPGVVKGQLIDAGNAQALAQIDVVFLSFTAPWGKMVPCRNAAHGQPAVRRLGRPRLCRVHGQRRHQTPSLRDAGLNIAPFVTSTCANRDKHSFAQISGELGLPLFVKPANQGSSVGVSKVTSEAEFTQAVRLAFEF